MDKEDQLDISCIVCHKHLEQAFAAPGNDYFQPGGAVAFSGSGHYGSDYDMSVELLISVCDECLTNALDAGRVFTHEKPKPARGVYRKIERKDAYDESRSW